MGLQRRRRHNDGPFYWNSSMFRPTSWGVDEGPLTWNETNHRGSLRLPFGFVWRWGRGRHR